MYRFFFNFHPPLTSSGSLFLSLSLDYLFRGQVSSITDFHVLCFRILRELLTGDGVEISDPYLYNEETRKKYSPNIKSAAARIPGVIQIAFDYKAVVDER